VCVRVRLNKLYLILIMCLKNIKYDFISIRSLKYKSVLFHRINAQHFFHVTLYNNFFVWTYNKYI